MKIVYCPIEKEVIEIDETKEKDRKDKYYHRSGVPFEGKKEKEIVIVKVPVEEKKEETITTSNDSPFKKIEGLRKDFFEKFGKEVSNRYRNDVEWIEAKLAE